MSVIEELLDAIPLLRGRDRVRELSGGLTNRNYRVDVGSESYVVRHSVGDTGLLGIDRQTEEANSRAAYRAGVAPEVVDYRPDLGVLVIAFVTGRTLADRDLAMPSVLARAAESVRRLHAGPRFAGDFDMFERNASYRRRIAADGLWLPDDYDDHGDRWRRIGIALGRRPVAAVPCNNDLLAANFIDDGDRVWLIDYEYSGNNDPAFELGNTATECEFTDEQTAAWVSAYTGPDRPEDPAFLARVRLQAVVSAYGWSLWGFIQAAASDLDYDFRQWGLHRYHKAVRAMTG
ncbi:MAG: phosphotransferase, partial [Nocardioides sp.]